MKLKLCILVTPPFVLHSLYRGQIKYLSSKGFDITAMSAPGESHQWLNNQGIKTVAFPLKREPHIFYDLYALIRLIIHFAFNRYNIVSVSTPKAALLGAIATRLTFQPNIIYTVRGRAYENFTGRKRQFFEFLEKITCAFSHKIISISKEIREDFIADRICQASKIYVLGSGSGNGVDLNTFNKSSKNTQEGQNIRAKFGIKSDDIVLLFVGRIRREKGINELVKAFQLARKTHSNIHLILQGTFEDVDPVEPDVLETINQHPSIHLIEWNKHVEYTYSSADILCFPSHREGFGNIAIEASAMGLPVIANNVVGCRESVKDKVSGYLIDTSNIETFAATMNTLIENKILRDDLGQKGLAWVKENYTSEFVWNNLINFYNACIKER